MKVLKNILPLIFVLGLSFFAVLPFFHAGFFPIHDNTQVQRVFEMSKSLRDGMIPVRWVLDLGFGYGYPIFNFYAPFAYYVGSFINLLGFNALMATKIMMVLGILVSGASMYLFAKEVWGKAGGVLASLLYVFAPFHAVDIYVRGDVAEFWAYALTPFVFYGLLNVHKSSKFRFVIIGALAFAGLIISHNLTAFMATPFILMFAVLLFLGNKKTGINLLLTLILGLLLSAFYWMPALTEINYTNVFSQIGGGADYKDHFVCLSQLWSSPWGFGGSVKGCIDGLSFMIGKLQILLFILSVLITFVAWKLNKVFDKKIILVVFFSFLLLVSIFLTLDYSKPVWDFIKPMAVLQYPWRFLLMVAFCISFIAGGFIYFIDSLFKNKSVVLVIAIVLSLIIVGFSDKYFIAQAYFQVSSQDFTSVKVIKFDTSKISSEYMPKNFQKPNNFSQIPNLQKLSTKDILIVLVKQKTQGAEFKINVKKTGNYIFPIAYFPAWKANLDSKEIKILEEKSGISVNLPSGQHNLKFTFIQTPVERISNLISIAGILSIILGIIFKKKLL
jgi:uncharacterized membrane protein